MPNTEQSIENTGGVPVIEVEVDVFGMAMYPTDKSLSIADMPADAKATGDAIESVNDEITDILLDIKDLQEKTGEDIPLNSEEGSPTIAEAVANAFYPVGSLYMTVSDTLPDAISALGTWEEVLIPMTWGDIRTGTRNYAEMTTGQTGGTLHMWIRTA